MIGQEAASSQYRQNLRRQPDRPAAGADQRHGDTGPDDRAGLADNLLAEHDAGAGDPVAPAFDRQHIVDRRTGDEVDLHSRHGEREAFRICLALLDVESGTVTSKAKVFARKDGVDITPTAVFRDSPAWLAEAATQAYIDSCQATKPGWYLNCTHLTEKAFIELTPRCATSSALPLSRTSLLSPGIISK